MAEVRRTEEEKEREAFGCLSASLCLLPAAKGRRERPPTCRISIESSSDNRSKNIKPLAAISTTEGPTLPGSGPVDLRIQRPLKTAVMSGAILAAMVRVEGKDVQHNEDNQILDWRELSLAGVNTLRLGGVMSSRSKPNPNLDQLWGHIVAYGFNNHAVLLWDNRIGDHITTLNEQCTSTES